MHFSGSLAQAPRKKSRLSAISRRARASVPSRSNFGLAVLSAVLLILAFPDFEVWPLAWIGLVPLLLAILRKPIAQSATVLGWTTGTIFFYATCHWLTYPMIQYAGIPIWLAYPLLFPGALVLGFFHGLFAGVLARLIGRHGPFMIFLAPVVWISFEWVRLQVTGQLWNAIGYSQAFIPQVIQSAQVGSVYAVGLLVVLFNAALAYILFVRTRSAFLVSAAAVAVVALVVVTANIRSPAQPEDRTAATVVALQPNIIPDFHRTAPEMSRLSDEHFVASARALERVINDHPRVVVWPESPMNFSLARNAEFRERAIQFARDYKVSLLFNSLEPAPQDGAYNSAVLIDDEGRLAAQYDKIRLMPFGEYVPLPRWFPAAGMIRGVVGEFTPGSRYSLMPIGRADGVTKAGVFICLESAYPHITRRFAEAGADVLIEITNDAYQGDGAILRQHLSNAVFRAVETGRPTLRVTNTGITARINSRGEIVDAAEKRRADVRLWNISSFEGHETFYTKNGDVLVLAAGLLSILALAFSLSRRLQESP